jgi:predicted acylesterase/phospholipase RssA
MVTDEASPQPTAPESGPDQKASAAPDTTTTETAALGLALSGGGVRAALFSLGVVIGLIETECHRQLRCVASVSGGSILNAALAHEKSLASFSSLTEFEPLASKLAASLAWQGTFAFDWRTVVSFFWNLIGKALPFALPFAGALILWAFQSEVPLIAPIVTLIAAIVSEVPLVIVGSIAVGVLLLAIYYRGLLQEARFASVLGAVAGVGQRLYVRDWGAISGEQGPGVMHVLVATDLLSGEPIYFSSKFIHCKPYGWSTPEQIRTAEALYSSAAFPAVFPPKKLKTSRLRFQDGDMPGPLPRTLRLADGGVYNNLGNDWFEILKKQSQASPPLLWPFGELSVEPSMIETKNVIIVNAGARSRRLQRLGPFPLARIMSVLYDNTVRPRVKLIRADDFPLIDIEQTPFKLANSLAELDGDVGRRAQALITKFDGRTDDFWADFGRDTAGTKTKLTGAGRRVAARLMLHGYLSSLALLHAKFEGKIPEQIRGEGYFLKLVDKELPLKTPARAEASKSDPSANSR